MDFWFWIALVWAIVASVAWYVVTVGRVFGLPLPVPDRGFRFLICKGDNAKEAVVEILRSNGLEPGWRMDSGRVHRVLMKDRMTVVNSADEELLKQMDNPGGTIAIPVSDPRKSAESAVHYLKMVGFYSRMAPLLEVPGKPEAMFYIVSQEAFPHGMIIFRLSMMETGKPDLVPWNGSRF
jgi:hypothetical protein